MRRSVLWDSSAILALIDADDADHGVALEAARGMAAERRPCFITNYIEAEAHALLLRKLGRAIAREWLLAGRLTVVPALPAEEARARSLITTHTDKDWTFCDAVSFAIMESRKVSRAFTFDHHFRQFGRFEILGG